MVPDVPLVEYTNIFIEHNKKPRCWWLSDTMSQSISSHSIYFVFRNQQDSTVAQVAMTYFYKFDVPSKL